MVFAVVSPDEVGGFIFWGMVVGVSAATSLLVFSGLFFWWSRREKARSHFKAVHGLPSLGQSTDQLFVSDRDAASASELVAQFKVRHGKQVVSVLEANGKRFIHVEGDLSAPERARMIRYLRSEGFMS